MTTAELKQLLVKKINDIDDGNKLEFIKDVIELEEQNTEVYKLSETEMKLIDKSEHQIENGEYFTNDQVFDEIDKWQKEKFWNGKQISRIHE